MPIRRRTSVGTDAGVVDVVAVEQDLAGQLGAGDHLVHPVEDAQERGLAAPRRADQRGDGARLHLQRDPLQHLVVAEPGRDVAGLEADQARRAAGRRGGRIERGRVHDLGVMMLSPRRLGRRAGRGTGWSAGGYPGARQRSSPLLRRWARSSSAPFPVGGPAPASRHRLVDVGQQRGQARVQVPQHGHRQRRGRQVGRPGLPARRAEVPRRRPRPGPCPRSA